MEETIKKWEKLNNLEKELLLVETQIKDLENRKFEIRKEMRLIQIGIRDEIIVDTKIKLKELNNEH